MIKTKKNKWMAVLLIALLPFLFVLLFIQSSWVQTWVAKRVADYFSKEWNTNVKMDGFSFDWGLAMHLEGFLIMDQSQDTLLAVQDLVVEDYLYDWEAGLNINEILLKETFVNLKKSKDGIWNYQFILKHFNSKKDTSDSLAWNISLHQLKFQDARFNFTDEPDIANPENKKGSINWAAMQWQSDELTFNQIYANPEKISLFVNAFNMKEIGGYEVKNLHAAMVLDKDGVIMDDVEVQTKKSKITSEVRVNWSGQDTIDLMKSDWDVHLSAYPFQWCDLSLLDKRWETENQSTRCKIQAKGNVDQLELSSMQLEWGMVTKVDLSGKIRNVLDWNNGYADFEVQNLQTNYADIHQAMSLFSLDKTVLPKNFETLGLMTYQGHLQNQKFDWRMYGDFNSAIGSLNGDVDLSLNEKGHYSGYLELEDFDLGAYYHTSQVGSVSANLDIHGEGLALSEMNVELDGDISAMELLDYNYRDISVSGLLENRAFIGDVVVNDPNADLIFSGGIDFKREMPELKCDLTVHSANLKSLGILGQWPYSNISGTAQLNTVGIKMDEFQGELILSDVSYCTDKGDYILDYLSLDVTRDNGLKVLLNSDIAMGELSGDFNLKDVALAIEDIVFSVVPRSDVVVRQHELQKFSLVVDVLDFSQISAAFNLNVGMSQNARLKMEVDEYTSFFDCTFIADSISIGEVVWYGALFDVSKPDDFIYASISCDSLMNNGKWMESMSIDARAENDLVYFDWVWGDASTTHAGDIGGKFYLEGQNQYKFDFYRGDVRLKSEKWQIVDGSSLAFSNDDFWFNNLSLISNAQSIDLNGVISKSDQNPLLLTFSNVNFKSLNAFLPMSVQLNGTLDGSLQLTSVLDNPEWSSNLSLSDFGINDKIYGDITLESNWIDHLSAVSLKGGLENAQVKTLDFEGMYFPKDSIYSLDIDARLYDFDLAFIQSFVDSTIIDIDGLANADLKIAGSLDDPQLTGSGIIKKGVLGVDYLKTQYYIEDRIWIEPDRFAFQNVVFKDESGNQGELNGYIGHEQFQKWSFDILADMDKEPMRLLNTKEEDNPDYYGRAYATGFFHLTGTTENLGMSMAFKTALGTKLNLPMNSGEVAEMGQFIHFVSSKNLQTNVAPPMDLSGISLDIQIDITPDAELAIIFDEAVGDVMKGKGTGHVSLGISKLATFDMYGQIEIASGSYLFTLKNLINKEFQIQPGGTISWYGNPYEAELNLNALYKVNASLSDVLADQSTNAGQRVPVDLVMNLKGKMLNPSVDFKIDLPSVDPLTKSRFESIVSTEQERNRQAFALLVLRQFVSPPNIVRTTNTATNNLFVENSTELLSSQISNWLSQISDDFNLGFNYRSGDQISNEEVALALSTQLFDNRVQLSGNFGVSRGNATNQQPSNYIGDVKVEYLLTREGRLKLIAYNESNNYRNVSTQQSPYTQGVGIVYQEDFNHFSDIIKKWSKAKPH